LLTEQGTRTADIAAAIGYQTPNTWAALRVLHRSELVEAVPGDPPRRWRLAARYRSAVSVFARIAAKVGAREWTTAGDISLAARGDIEAAATIARAAVAVPHFPHPERILATGGVIHPYWHGIADHDEKYLYDLLRQQGVRFIDGHADPSQRVTWDELQRRDCGETIPSD
jgi:hypothetical protein